MSLAEFSSALKNKAINEWFKIERAGGGSASASARAEYSAANINNLVNPTSDYRSAEQTAKKTSFVITKDTIKSLLVDLKGIQAGSDELEEMAGIYFNAFRAKNAGVQVNRRKITVGDGIPAVYFSSISFQSITDLVNNIMNLKAGELAKFYEKGHVVGLNTELLQATTSRIQAIDTRGSTGKAFLVNELNKVIEYYKRLDYDSANIQPASDVKVYASVNKSINKTGETKYIVELQPKAANQRSADEVKSTIGTIRKLFSPNGLTDKALGELIDKLRASVTDPKFQQDLLDLKSSPNFKEMVVDAIAGAITGNPINQNYSHNNVEIATKKAPKVDLTQLQKIVKDELKKVEELKKKLTASPVDPIRTRSGQFYSLASLQQLLNDNLQNVVAANMGGVERKDILNYQTGRFAASVKVEKLSQSREGMITAYYNYMKNPYQTFEPGYKQGAPKTRDPKLLIAKSIREIAETKVANRMRAVLV